MPCIFSCLLQRQPFHVTDMFAIPLKLLCFGSSYRFRSRYHTIDALNQSVRFDSTRRI
ncbi:hypothetical protein QR685DRAFT_259920 [Neurospora intermedia]|uniref:Uncharacterized protein n=1 Tax=Neurospora intermedia TaxID=5142 RepID=A0ABR3DD75_NEUIN